MLGIDPSLSSTGYAFIEHGKLVTGCITTDKLCGAHRLVYIRNQVSRILDRLDPTLVVMEDYAMGARGNNMFHIGEMGGVLKAHMWENGFDVLSIPPTVMKSAIALNGRADKKDITLALAKRFAIKVLQHDEADAVGLMLVGEMRCGIRRTEVCTDAKSKAQSQRFESIRVAPLALGKGRAI